MRTKLKTALDNLGFPEKEQHIALIENLYISNSLTKKNIWESINIMGQFPDKQNIYALIYHVLSKAKAFNNNIESFDARYILDNLFAEPAFDKSDIKDFILYWGQFAFGRESLQDKNNAQTQPWMDDKNLRNKYIANCHILGLVEAIYPNSRSFDEVWLTGTEYLLTLEKLEFLENIIGDGCTPGIIRLLSGKRELSVELDSKNYILELANKLNIQYNKQSPFVQKADGKKYLNYSLFERRKVYESDMIVDLTTQIINDHNISLIDSAAIAHKKRPDTIATCLDAANALLYRIKETDLKEKNKINILICSNQPFIERQYVAAKRTIKEVLNKNNITVAVNVERCGFGLRNEMCHTTIHIIHSDGLGAYISELYKNTTQAPKRPISSLLYQTREKTKEMLSYLNSPSLYIPVLIASIAVNSLLLLSNTTLYNAINYNLLFIATATLYLAAKITLDKGILGLHTTLDLLRKEGPISFVQKIKDADWQYNIPTIPTMAY